MIKFFRLIRQKLISENKFSKYLFYAIGEIVLVVIGILIALQINSWYQTRLDFEKEEKFLLEIKENLNEDLKKINEVISANAFKLKKIDSAYYYLSLMKENPALGKDFSYQMPVITNHKLFTPTRVAFNNITSTGKIDILRSDPLRKDISRYYSDVSLDGVQNQIVSTTQRFLDNVAPKMINKTMMKFITKKDFDVIAINEVKVHTDPEILSGLFVLTNKTFEHNQKLEETKVTIAELIAAIDSYLNSK
ncbi:DUF6090 family protein [Croceivirga thetidis]|uniref:Uncharacterized protein n=1 Tax=Croceivirga thetidis TaxID=2721623 RepID=A0ABX1GPA9_9FLAO|nr:DUF6090 family protein [Croceivirga thetidis]NKI30926.1 hypothetical protein [Croceivirga thetidis]